MNLQAGSLMAYMMDAMRYKEGSFMTLWMSLALTNLCLGYSTLFLDNEYSIPTAILGLCLHSGVLLLTGLWGTLQFKWIQVQYPAVNIAFEKMMLVGCIPVCGGVVSWGLITHNGISGAPYIASGILCVMYAFFGRPLQSSFLISPHRIHTGGSSMKLKTIQDPLDSAISFLFVLVTPPLTYLAAHHQVIWSWTHLWSIMLLMSGPLLFMSAIPQGLWWLGDGGIALAAKRALVLISSAGLLAGIEGRIVFHSFGQYIKLTPPFSYVTITFGMYSVAAVVLLYISGSLDNQTAVLLLGPITMVSTAMGCLVVGVPIWALPAPLICAGGIAMYCESKTSRDYMLVICGGLVTGAWFIWHHFWFLDIVLDGMNLRTFCVLVFIAMVPAFAIPWLISSRLPGVSLLMILQASLMVILEEHLYSGDFMELTFGAHPMFPASLVVASSLLGVFLTRKMHEMQHIENNVSFLLQCIYGAKVSMICIPETRITIPVVCYALASLYPFSSEEKRLVQSDGSKVMRFIAITTVVFGSVVVSRFALFDTLQMLLDRKPSESLVAGVLLLAFVLGVFPSATKYCDGMQFPRKVIIVLGSLGALMVMLRPPLPIKGGSECPNLPLALCPRLWDAAHNPNHEHDDIAVYGDGIRRREHWPLWLIIFASLSGISAATSKFHRDTRFAPTLLLQGSASGLLVGAYMALEFFPGIIKTQALVIISCLVAAFIVVFLSVPSKGSMILVPIFGIMWISCLPLGLVLLSSSSLPPLPHDLIRLHPDIAEGMELDLVRKQASQMYLLCCIACEALVLAFCGKLRLTSYNSMSNTFGSIHGVAQDARYIDKAAEFLGGYISSASNRGTAGKVIGKNDTRVQMLDPSYLPEACNLITVYCFCLCLWINSLLDGEHAPAMILCLSPILLLLHQDSFLFRSLTERQRYFPPFVVGTVLLTFTAIGTLFEEGISIDGGITIEIGIAELFLNIILILLCFAPLLEMVEYLRRQHRPRILIPGLSGLLVTCGIFLSSFEAIKILSGLAGVTSVLLISISHQEKRSFSRAL